MLVGLRPSSVRRLADCEQTSVLPDCPLGTLLCVFSSATWHSGDKVLDSFLGTDPKEDPMYHLHAMRLVACLALLVSLVAIGKAVPDGPRVFASEAETILEIAVDELTGRITAYPAFRDDHD